MRLSCFILYVILHNRAQVSSCLMMMWTFMNWAQGDALWATTFSGKDQRTTTIPVQNHPHVEIQCKAKLSLLMIRVMKHYFQSKDNPYSCLHSHHLHLTGYVCSRLNLMPNGCCKPESEGTKHYSCETCHNNGCCSIYEYCISCCLQPDKVLQTCTPVCTAQTKH